MIAPKYRRIFEELSSEIATGRYPAGVKFPSEAELVRRFGASRITIGHAIRELQRQGLVDRLAGSGTYVRSRPTSLPEAPLFGLIIPNLGETEIFEPICRAIAASPAAENQSLLWPNVRRGAIPDLEAEAITAARQCIARAVDGVFFAPLEMTPNSAEVNRRVLAMLKEASLPVVFLDRRPDDLSPRERVDLVGIDNHRAGLMATRHLIETGARRIAFAAYPGQASTVKSRIQGYRVALEEAGINPSPVLYLDPADHSVPLEPYDAFVCANDRLAGGLMHYLLGRGAGIPADIRLVGIDDVNYASLLPVPLTTVHQPCSDLGDAALRVMLERMARPHMPARDVLLDCPLVVRKSSWKAGYAPSPMIAS